MPRAAKQTAFADPAVEAVFRAYPGAVRKRLLALRRLILDTALTTDGVGRIEETLKWGQPSYLTQPKSGSTIRIDQVPPDGYALHVHCRTNLVATFREFYPTELAYGGNRSILLDAGRDPPEAILRHCIALALTYHSRKAGKQPLSRTAGEGRVRV
jgi:hypothetical protein